MKIRIKNTLLNLALLATIVSLFFKGTPFTLTAFFLTFLYCVSSPNFYWYAHRDRLVIYLIIPIFLGLMFSWRNSSIDIIRDVVLFSMPIVYVLAGKKMRSDEIDYQRVVYNFSGIYCLFFFGFATFHFFSGEAFTFESFRSFVSAGSFLLVICMVFLIKNFRHDVSYLNKFLLWFCPLIIVLESSRTYYFILFIFLVLSKKSRFVYRLTVIFTIIAMVYLLVWIFYFSNGGAIDLTALEKLYAELAFKDTWTPDDVGTSYRAYEAFSSINSYLTYSAVNMALGGGFGALVDLGFPVLLSGAYYTHIPWVHNGYMYMLIKVGFVGLALYTVFFLVAIKRSYSPDNIQYGAILRATVLGMLFANFVICGLFSQQFAFAYILLGYFLSTGAKRLPKAVQLEPNRAA